MFILPPRGGGLYNASVVNIDVYINVHEQSINVKEQLRSNVILFAYLI